MKYYGPSTQFESATGFGRAAAICELENIACRLDPYQNRIHFRDAEAEKRFTIAWQKAVAGLSSRATRPTEGQSQWTTR